MQILYTAKDIEAEHDAAVASLSPAQRRAFARMARFEPEAVVFSREAESRTFRAANDGF